MASQNPLLALRYFQQSQESDVIMCLLPLSIFNPARKFAIKGGNQLKITVGCGKCAHCVTRKRDEYSFRTYWHTKSIIDKGGYVLFDTLTYDNKHLPHIGDFLDCRYRKLIGDDFSCFNLEHYKLFFKRLRRAIERKYHLTDAISYFFSTEYGDDDRYTHRPHYHILIFVKTNKIHPLWLSRKINQCWQYGRTDGINWKSFSYVAKHIYGYDLGLGANDDKWILRAVTHYVAKYINKSIEFQKELDKRYDNIVTSLMTDDVELIKSIFRHISMFHRQSKGYGLDYLNYIDDEQQNAIYRDCCLLPDKSKIVKELPLPMYYIRKLYYTTQKRSDGTTFWQLTDKGKEHKLKRMLDKIPEQVTNLNDLYTNATAQQKSYIKLLLDGRSFHDYCIYMNFYHGRIRSFRAMNHYTDECENDLVDDELLELGTMQQIIYDSFDNNLLHYTECYESFDKHHINVTNYLYSDIPYADPYLTHRRYTKKDFLKFTFHQNSCYNFRNYDVLTSLLNSIKQEQSKFDQSTYDHKLRLANTLKLFTHVNQ